MNGAVFFVWLHAVQADRQTRSSGEFSEEEIAARQTRRSRSRLTGRLALSLATLSPRTGAAIPA
jgi:hypothetical protein